MTALLLRLRGSRRGRGKKHRSTRTSTTCWRKGTLPRTASWTRRRTRKTTRKTKSTTSYDSDSEYPSGGGGGGGAGGAVDTDMVCRYAFSSSIILFRAPRAPMLYCRPLALYLAHPYPSRHAHATLTIIPVVARAAFLFACQIESAVSSGISYRTVRECLPRPSAGA